MPRVPSKRKTRLSLSSHLLSPEEDSSDAKRALKRPEPSGLEITDKTEAEAAGDVEDIIQLPQCPVMMELKKLENERTAKEKKMEDIDKELKDVDMKITTTQQRIDELTQARQHAMSEQIPSRYDIEDLELRFNTIKKSLTSDTLKSPERESSEAEKAQVMTQLTDAERRMALHKQKMADFAAKERAMNDDRDRYQRDYTRLQRSLEKLTEECDLLTTEINARNKNLVATRVDASRNSSSSAQDADSDEKKKKVRVSCPCKRNFLVENISTVKMSHFLIYLVPY